MKNCDVFEIEIEIVNDEKICIITFIGRSVQCNIRNEVSGKTTFYFLLKGFNHQQNVD